VGNRRGGQAECRLHDEQGRAEGAGRHGELAPRRRLPASAAATGDHRSRRAWTELIRPPLTVVRQPIDMLALHSVELVHARMRQKLPPAPRRVRVAAEFLERSSTARI
jgi:hypothetical protein